MPKSFIKPSSHAQVQGRRYLDTTRAICERVGITKEEWLHLMFETGCQFVHQREPDYAAAHRTLTDPAEGFWAFFLAEWMADDEELLGIACEYSPEYYTDLKSAIAKPRQNTLLAV